MDKKYAWAIHAIGAFFGAIIATGVISDPAVIPPQYAKYVYDAILIFGYLTGVNMLKPQGTKQEYVDKP